MTYRQKLERNLKIFLIRGMFERRAYLPIITIYATTVAGVSLAQIGIIASVTAFAQMIFEVPSGYLADKLGRKKALLLGAFLMTLSTLLYVIWPNFFGACLAVNIFWIGASFHSGTLQAFIHETLLELGRDDEYINIATRERRYAMAGNLILVALVPLSYSLSPIAPFLIGSALHLCALLLYSLMQTPKEAELSESQKDITGFWQLIKSSWQRKEFFFFFFIGITGAAHNAIPEFRELYLKLIGVPVWSLGLFLSFIGILTIILSYQIPKLKKVSPKTFFLFDYLMLVILCLLIGLISHPVLSVIPFLLLAPYRRLRAVVIEAHLLKNCPTKKLKATFLSLTAFLRSMNSIVLPLILGFIVGHVGIQKGYLLFGILCFLSFTPLYLFIRFRRSNF